MGGSDGMPSGPGGGYPSPHHPGGMDYPVSTSMSQMPSGPYMGGDLNSMNNNMHGDLHTHDIKPQLMPNMHGGDMHSSHDIKPQINMNNSGNTGPYTPGSAPLEQPGTPSSQPQTLNHSGGGNQLNHPSSLSSPPHIQSSQPLGKATQGDNSQVIGSDLNFDPSGMIDNDAGTTSLDVSTCTVKRFIFAGSNLRRFQNWTYSRGLKFAARQFICTTS